MYMKVPNSRLHVPGSSGCREPCLTVSMPMTATPKRAMVSASARIVSLHTVMACW